uniref:HDC15724 n=1 Tax=Drosophila melanogaster TaxID=7227 RepID=Q6IJ80_DROME|nr:TPA_inf: HDC15724 [Drosophila melanogaster]
MCLALLILHVALMFVLWPTKKSKHQRSGMRRRHRSRSPGTRTRLVSLLATPSLGLKTRESRIGTTGLGPPVTDSGFLALGSTAAFRVRCETVWFRPLFSPLGLANFLHTRSSWMLLPLAKEESNENGRNHHGGEPYTVTQDGRKIITLINEPRDPDPDINVIPASDLSALGSLDGRTMVKPSAGISDGNTSCAPNSPSDKVWSVRPSRGRPLSTVYVIHWAFAISRKRKNLLASASASRASPTIRKSDDRRRRPGSVSGFCT